MLTSDWVQWWYVTFFCFVGIFQGIHKFVTDGVLLFPGSFGTCTHTEVKDIYYCCEIVFFLKKINV